MNAEDTIHELTEPLNCPACNAEIEMVRDLVNSQPVTKNNLIVCGHCGTVCKVGDSNLVKLKRGEFEALDKQSKFKLGTISMAILAKLVKERETPSGGIN